MFQRNLMQALRGAVYPTVPAMWPNRAVRRAVKQGHEHRVPQEWRAAMAIHEGLRQAIKVL